MKRSRHERNNAKTDKTALVQIEKAIYGGAFLARLEGKATFTPLTLPGEQVRIRITEEKRSYAVAEPQEIVSPSPNRVQPPCPHFGVCGGCNYQHTTYESQLDLKQQILRETLQRAGVPAPEHIHVLADDPWAYRNRIRLAFDAGTRVGYRGRRSHDIIPIEECPITAPLLVKAALSAAEVLKTKQLSLEATELSLFCNAEEKLLLASIFVRRGHLRDFDVFAAALSESVPELAGVELVHQPLVDGTAQQLARWGEDSICYRAAGFDYRVHHGAFFQVNRWLIDSLVQRVLSAHRGALAWDLFAGVGLFARQLAEKFSEVMAVESAPAAIQGLNQNLRGTNGRSVNADTLSFLRAQSPKPNPDLIIVDPPRAGLGPEVTTILGNVAAPCIVYVSCDPSTLARDLKALLSSGYSIASVVLADLFPQTFHLETVVTLRKD
jgi:23S rRNA (uracil1939-C5)-methyltransferase